MKRGDWIKPINPNSPILRIWRVTGDYLLVINMVEGGIHSILHRDNIVKGKGMYFEWELKK